MRSPQSAAPSRSARSRRRRCATARKRWCVSPRCAVSRDWKRRSPRTISPPRSRTRCCDRWPSAYSGARWIRRGLEVLLKGLESGSRATREAAIEALLRVVSRSGSGATRMRWLRGSARRRAARSRRSTMRWCDSRTPISARGCCSRNSSASWPRPRWCCRCCARRAPTKRSPRSRSARSTASATPPRSSIDAHWDTLDGELRAQAASYSPARRGARGATRLDCRARRGGSGAARRGGQRARASRRQPARVAPLVRRLQLATEDSEPEAEEERAALIDALVKIATAPTGSRRGRAEPGDRSARGVLRDRQPNRFVSRSRACSARSAAGITQR